MGDSPPAAPADSQHGAGYGIWRALLEGTAGGPPGAGGRRTTTLVIQGIHCGISCRSSHSANAASKGTSQSTWALHTRKANAQRGRGGRGSAKRKGRGAGDVQLSACSFLYRGTGAYQGPVAVALTCFPATAHRSTCCRCWAPAAAAHHAAPPTPPPSRQRVGSQTAACGAAVSLLMALPRCWPAGGAWQLHRPRKRSSKLPTWGARDRRCCHRYRLDLVFRYGGDWTGSA